MNIDSSSENRCPVCNSADILSCIDVGRIPVHCNLLRASRDEAVRAPLGEMQLAYCADCGHLFNQAFDPGLMEYAGDYENSLHFSPRFQSYARSLAQRLIDDHGLRGKTVIEIGCGKGEFLSLLCELGAKRGVGFDPSYTHHRNGNGSEGPVTFIRDFYSELYSEYEADLVCCRHVLEHIHNPTDFLRGLRRAIGSRPDTVVFFEVPDALFTLRGLAIWDIIYEHRSYFSRHSLARAFGRSGFSVSNLGSAFEDQFLYIEARPGEGPTAAHHDRDGLAQLKSDVRAFADRHRSKVDEWKRRLDRMRLAGKRAVVWGAGSKGVTFLNMLEVGDQIPYVVDLNPRKHGMFVPRTGQQIVSPEFLRDYRPDVVIVMNSIYEGEIRQLTKEHGLSVELLCA